MGARYSIGDWVVYRVSKTSPRPGPRAQHVHPLPSGENYSYTVDKFWIVANQTPEGDLLLRTRTGKERRVAPDDRSLRRANIWERWFHAARFPDSRSASNRSAAESP